MCLFQVSENSTESVVCLCNMIPALSGVHTTAVNTSLTSRVANVTIQCLSNCDAFIFTTQELRLRSVCHNCPSTPDYSWSLLYKNGTLISDAWPQTQEFSLPSHYFQLYTDKQFLARAHGKCDVCLLWLPVAKERRFDTCAKG